MSDTGSGSGSDLGSGNLWDRYTGGSSATGSGTGASQTNLNARAALGDAYTRALHNLYDAGQNYADVITRSSMATSPIPGLSRIYSKFLSTEGGTRDGVLSQAGINEYYNLYNYLAKQGGTMDNVFAQLYADTANGVIDNDDFAGLLYTFGIVS